MKKIINFLEDTPRGRHVVLWAAMLIGFVLTYPLTVAPTLYLLACTLGAVVLFRVSTKYDRFRRLNSEFSNWDIVVERRSDDL